MGNSGPVCAEPVDANVKQALSEIETAERQMRRLTRDLRVSIERLAQRVEGAATRLESSPHKTHPSWRAANERVDELMVRLARWNRSGNATTH